MGNIDRARTEVDKILQKDASNSKIRASPMGLTCKLSLPFTYFRRFSQFLHDLFSRIRSFIPSLPLYLRLVEPMWTKNAKEVLDNRIAYTGLGFKSGTFSCVSPWINIRSICGVMFGFDCNPTPILLRTSSTRRAVLWLCVESRTCEEKKDVSLLQISYSSSWLRCLVGNTTSSANSASHNYSKRFLILFSNNSNCSNNKDKRVFATKQ